MFVELNKDNYFVQYHSKINNVSLEHKDFVIEITEELYQSLQNKMPWKLNQILSKVYCVEDISQFIEIVATMPKSELEILKETVDALVIASLGV